MASELLNAGAEMRLIDMSATDVFIGMGLAFALSVILARVTAVTAPTGTQTKNLPRTMVLLSVTVSLIMAVIGNSLARAFGAIGALSLIRFRTAVKESRDLAHLFMSISIGMACGSGYFKISIGATALLCVASLLLEKLPLTDSGVRFCLLRIRFPREIDINEKLMPILRARSKQLQVLGQEALDEGKTIEMVVELAATENQQLDDLVLELSKMSPTVKASIMMG